MTRTLVYTATPGYLFQTVVSATSAKKFAVPGQQIVVIYVGAESTAEWRTFRPVCESVGIDLLSSPALVPGELSGHYARFFVDAVLPSDCEEIIYLDGDTQVVGSLESLFDRAPGPGRIGAVRDPMVLGSLLSAKRRKRVARWRHESGILSSQWFDYVNSGVLRFSLQDLPGIRAPLLALGSELSREPRFKDQDLLNAALANRIDFLPLKWNFPAFLLASPSRSVVEPIIVHYMSNPRPWNASLAPWGDQGHAPYVEFVQRFPSTRPFWHRFSAMKTVRYRAQFWFKRLGSDRAYYGSASSNFTSILSEGSSMAVKL